MKNKNLIIILGTVILITLVGYFVLYPKEEVPLQDEIIVNDAVVDFPELFVDVGGEYLLFEERITKIVSELKRSPAARFSIVIQGNVRDFFDRTIIVEAREETLEVLVAEGAVVVTEVWPEIPIPEEIAELPTEDFMLFDLLMQIEMTIEQGFLPEKAKTLVEIRDYLQEKVAGLPEQEMRDFIGVAPVVPDEPVRVREPFNLQDIEIGDIVVIQAKITLLGELQAFEVIVTPID